jgi:DegV family protein with EDD domain
MRPVKIITDSCADIGRELREKYDIDYARMNTQYDGKELPASLDWEFYTPKALYDIMRQGNRVLTTQVPVEEFRRIFRLYLDGGYDIVYIGCSLKQSGSVNTGSVIAKELHPEYPDAQVICIDSLNASMGEGMLAVRAAGYRDAGMTAQEIALKVVTERKLVNEFCTVHTLDALKRSGRVKASAAFLGNLFGVKPIILADANGYQTPLKKVRGRQASIQEIVSLLKESIVAPETQTVYIAHADCMEEALALKQLVQQEIPCRDIYLDYIGPIIGSSVGPDTLAVFGFGKEVIFKG